MIVKNLIVCILLPFLSVAQQQGFQIDGRMTGLVEGEKVTMLLSTWRWEGSDDFFESLVKTDSGYVKNGVFHISGIVPDGPRLYVMEFDRHTSEFQNAKSMKLVIDNNEQLTIRSSDINKIDHGFIEHYVTIEGSPTNHSYECIQAVQTLYYQSRGLMNRYIRKIKDSIGFNGPLLTAIFETREQLNNALSINFLSANIDPDIQKANLFLISDFKYSGNAAFWVAAYSNLNDKSKNSFYGKILKEYTTLCKGKPFPLFTLHMPDGRPLALKDVLAKSKLTIVHFWADQSTEREKYQDELKVFYKKYNTRGLNIVGISSDSYAEQWKESIARNELPWYNVSDLKGKDGMVGSIYHEYGTDKFSHNTTNVLLDSNGLIIAWDVSGQELQWYLWRVFGE